MGVKWVCDGCKTEAPAAARQLGPGPWDQFVSQLHIRRVEKPSLKLCPFEGPADWKIIETGRGFELQCPACFRP